MVHGGSYNHVVGSPTGWNRIANTLVRQQKLDVWRSARVMALVVHPYLMGVPHRVKHLRRVLEVIRQKRDVLFWTGAQIADWYLAAGPAAP